MSAAAIRDLAQRLERSDPADAHEQREIFERLRELRATLQGARDAERGRCLEAAGMLVAYLARMGALAGEDVLPIAVRLLRAAGDVAPIPGSKKAPRQPPRSATELVGEMLLGQILVRRGYATEGQIEEALRVQRAKSGLIGDVLIGMGVLTSEQVVEALHYQDACRRIRENYVEPTGKKTPSRELLDQPLGGLKLVGEVLLGEILVERGTITRKQLERALDVQRAAGVRIGEALVQIGALTWEQIENALRIQEQMRRRAS